MCLVQRKLIQLLSMKLSSSLGFQMTIQTPNSLLWLPLCTFMAVLQPAGTVHYLLLLPISEGNVMNWHSLSSRAVIDKKIAGRHLELRSRRLLTYQRQYIPCSNCIGCHETLHFYNKNNYFNMFYDTWRLASTIFELSDITQNHKFQEKSTKL